MKKDDVERLIVEHVASAVASGFQKVKESEIAVSEKDLDDGIIGSLEAIVQRIENHKESFKISLSEFETSVNKNLSAIEEKVNTESVSTARLLEKLMESNTQFREEYEPSVKRLKKSQERYSTLAFNVLSAVFISTAIACVALVGKNIINK
jgi:hypothetical protein